MNELRKDYLLNRWVIISKGRGKRPQDFRHEENREVKSKVCFFCPGNEHLTPPEICRVEENNEWIIRCFPNKFPAVTPEEGKLIENSGNFLTSIPAYGEHEVIVETPEHDKNIDDLSAEHIVKVLDVCSKRIEESMNNKKIKYAYIFKNWGLEGGASLSHTHIQLISLPQVPGAVQEKISASKKYDEKNKSCPYCDISNAEMKTKRGIFEDEHAASFAPFASRFPFEVWIMPKRHVKGIKDMTEAEKYSFAKILKKILMKLKTMLNDPPYNILFYFAPDESDCSNLHFHVEICPRLAKWAGFEFGSGIVINTMSPEDAAEFYKS